MERSVKVEPSDSEQPFRYGDVVVRGVTPEDREFVLTAVHRLSAFGAPAGRTREEIVDAEARALTVFFDKGVSEVTLLVADAGGQPRGFVYLEDVRDYFTDEQHGHIGILVVAGEAEGRGVGRALMLAAEDWARARQYRKLTLNVFEGNRRARGVYEHLGYNPDTVKYLKLL